MKITQVTHDWADPMDGKQMAAAVQRVGPGALVYHHQQTDVDEEIYFIASQELTRNQLTLLWREADIWAEGVVVYGRDFDEALRKLSILNQKWCKEDSI